MRNGDMKKILFILVYYISISLIEKSAYASDELRHYYMTPKNLAMGGVGTAVSDDWTAIFWNPGLIGKKTGIELRPFALSLEVGESVFRNYKDFSGTSKDVSTTIKKIMNKDITLYPAMVSAIYLPYMGFAYFYNYNGVFDAENPAYPKFDIGVWNDSGFKFSFGIPIVETNNFGLRIGAGATYITRTGVRGDYDLLKIVNYNEVTDKIQNSKGKGIGADLGLSSTVSLGSGFNLELGVSWLNVGNITFRSINGAPPPHTEPDNLSAGMGVTYRSCLLYTSWVFIANLAVERYIYALRRES